MHGNRIEHNVGQRRAGPGSYGGGISCDFSDDVVLSDNMIRHNAASMVNYGGYGGGLYIGGSDRMRLEGNTFEANSGAAGAGGALFASNSHGVLLAANRVLSNSASLGGGLYILGDSTFTMTNNVVARNSGRWVGGGMELKPSSETAVTGTLLHNTFAENSGDDAQGQSAIFAYATNVSLVLTNNLISSHTVGVGAVSGARVELYNTLFYDNEFSTSGAGSFTNTDPIIGEDPRLGGSYHLLSDSSGIDAGVDAGVLTDIDGDLRPYGAGPDIGADESVWRLVYLPLVVKMGQAGS